MRKRSTRKSSSFFKRGNVQEVAFIIGIAFVFSFAIFFGYKILHEFNGRFGQLDVDPLAKATVNRVDTIYPSIFDSAYLVVLVIFFLIAVISAYFIDIHPFFFVLSLFVLIVALVASALLVNINEEVITDEKFADISDKFPIIVFTTQHLFQIAVIMGGIIMIALYAKSRSGE